MRQKLTEELAIKKCKELNLQYIRIEKGKKDSYIVFICPKHNQYGEQKIRWSSLKKATIGCKYCSGKIVTTEIFEQTISPNVILLEEYQSFYKEINCKCKICNNIWSTTPASLKNGSACPECGKKKVADQKRKSQEQFEKEVSTINPNIKILGKYKNNKNKIDCKCSIHNISFKAQPVHLLEKDYCGCSGCYTDKMRKYFSKSIEKFIEELKEVFPYFEVIGEYINCETPIECICLQHNKKFKSRPADLLYGKNPCPDCATAYSKPEQKLYNILCKHYDTVIRQKTFEDCIYITKLKFDFFIPEINTLIEYDGEGHYWDVPFGGMSKESAMKQYELCKIRDEIKNEYCKKNNIPLIRIPYWEKENMEEYLYKQINCLS